MGSHPTNCHRIWEAVRCTWALKTDWISACIRVDYVCVHRTNFALSLIPCCTGQCRIYFRHRHIVSCISLYTLHILHTWCPLLSYHCTPPGVTHNIIVPCCTGQGGLRCGTSYRKPAANSIKLDTVVQVPCTKAALCFGQQPFNTLACQEAALHFNHALPMLFVLYSFHFIYIIVLCTSLCLRPNTCTYWNWKGLSGALW